MAQVLDASVAVAWCAAGQATPTTTAALEAVVSDGAIVPAPFWFEVICVLASLSQRGIVQRDDCEKFLEDVSPLKISVEPAGDIHTMITLRRMAEQYALSIYDCSYLDLALRTGLPLVTRDAALASAARAAGAVLFSR